ncbi:MAG: NAD(P)-binding domain-containing protein, partial [bacterium]
MTDSSLKTKNIAILGSGSWGTALAVLLFKNGHNVNLWEFFPDRAEKIDSTRLNPEFLPGVKIPSQIAVSSHLKETVRNKDIILIAVPSHIVRSVGEKLARIPIPDSLIVSASKGIENDTLLRMSEVIQ